MKYSYDRRGRLVTASSSDGTTRTYTYDDRGGLVMIREPGRIVRNSFDEAGRWSGQDVRTSDADDDPYLVTTRYTVEDGDIVEVEMKDSEGIERLRYDIDHLEASDSFAFNGGVSATFRFDRDKRTHVVRQITLSCGGAPTIRAIPVPAAVQDDDDVKRELIRKHCVPDR